MSTEWGINLSSTRIDEKSNEIPEMQKVMKQLDCRGCVVTADAMNTQKTTAKAIIEEAHGDYCLALKENQKTAYLEVKEYFACEELLKEVQAKEGQYFKDTEETTYDIITREYMITDEIKWFEGRKDWKKLTSIGYERKNDFQKGDWRRIHRGTVLSVQYQADRKTVRNCCASALAYRKWAALGARYRIQRR